MASNQTTAATASFADEDAAIKTTIEAWTQALLDGQYQTWIDHWTEDAFLMPPDHATLKGRDEILSFARDGFPGAGSFAFSDWRIEGHGDLAVVVNTIRWGDTRFRQMIALRRRNGDWKVQLVIINTGAAE